MDRATIVTVRAWLLPLLLTFVACGPSRPDATAPSHGTAKVAASEGHVEPSEPVPNVDLPGIDTAKMSPNEKRAFSRVIREYTSPCGDASTLEVCVREARACRKCLPAAKYAAKMVRLGDEPKNVRAWLDNRFSDTAKKTVSVGDSPTLGPSNAQLVVVEFADFECPHCAVAAPILHGLIEDAQLKGKMMLAFKNFPLAHHAHAEPAARAALAAQVQGKFWEMHDQIFAHQDTLELTDLEGFAKTVGLDVKKWQTDFASVAMTTRVAADHTLGEQVGVEGTPSIFINGRKFAPAAPKEFANELRNWLLLDLELAAP